MEIEADIKEHLTWICAHVYSNNKQNL
jgi:hypothetical protein